MICTFLGHKDAPETIKPILEKCIIDLIENKGIDYFIVGNNGAFDRMARSVLIKLRKEYNIKFNVIIAYMPLKKDKNKEMDYSDTILPDGIEKIPKKAAIPYRNKWMINKCNYVVAYVTHSWGGAATSLKYAIKINKNIIDLLLYKNCSS